jgi:hypothetical protein
MENHMINSQDFSKRMQAIREWVRTGSQLDPAHPGPADLSPLTDLNRLRDRVADIRARQILREQPFVSDLPLLGQLIVWVRSAWNWMSTKWYVIPLIQQQNNFNTLVAQAWGELLDYLNHVVLFVRDVYRRLDHLENRLNEMTAARMALPESSPPPQPVEAAGVIKVAAPGWHDLFDAGPVVVLSCGQGEAVHILAEQGTQVYGIESDAGLAQQGIGSALSIVHAGDVDHLASLPEGMLGGVLAVWTAPVSAQTMVRLLDQGRRTLRARAWIVWVWPWPVSAGETNAQLARSIALGMDFAHVRLDAHQRIDVAFQTLSIRK